MTKDDEVIEAVEDRILYGTPICSFCRAEPSAECWVCSYNGSWYAMIATLTRAADTLSVGRASSLSQHSWDWLQRHFGPTNNPLVLLTRIRARIRHEKRLHEALE